MKTKNDEFLRVKQVDDLALVEKSRTQPYPKRKAR